MRAPAARVASLAVFLGLVLAGASAPSLALVVVRSTASVQDGRYRYLLEAEVSAPVAAVRAVLADYAEYPALDKRIREARVLERESPQQLLLYTEVRGCVGFVFCRSLHRVERVNEAELSIIANVLPTRSDFTYGRTVTRLTDLGTRTRVTYETEFDAGGFLPRWLVGRSVLRALEEGGLGMFTSVERLARTRAAAVVPAAPKPATP